MLQVRDIAKWYGDVQVLDRVSFTLNRGERAGLIGPNGSGKSTLLRILTGELAPDRGSVHLSPSSLRVGYLPQALAFAPGATVGDVLGTGPRERAALEREVEHLAAAMAQAEDAAWQTVSEAYDRALAQLNALDGGRVQVLAGVE